MDSLLLALWLAAGAFAIGMVWRSKRDRAEALRHPVRRALWEAIQAHPGAHLAELQAAVGANRGTASYHLTFLERVDAVTVVRKDHDTRYFPTEATQREQLYTAVLMRGRIMEVVGQLLQQPGISQKEITRALPMTRKVFRKYADLLKKHGLVVEVRQDRLKKYYPTAELERAVLRPHADGRPPTGPSDTHVGRQA